MRILAHLGTIISENDGKRPPGVMDVVFGIASRREGFKRSKGRGSGEGRVPDRTAPDPDRFV